MSALFKATQHTIIGVGLVVLATLGSAFAATVTVQVQGDGTVTLEPSGGSYAPGTVVQIAAFPESGWQFDHWKITQTPDQPSVPMSASGPIASVLAAAALLACGVHMHRKSSTRAVAFLLTSLCMVSASPLAHAWTSTNNPETITVDEDMEVKASFVATELPEPNIKHIGMVKPNITQLTVWQQKVVPGEQTPYVSQPGDTIATPDPPEDPDRWITRGGTIIGTLVGPDDDIKWSFDTVEGTALDTTWAGTASNYTLTSPTDPNYTTAKSPSDVYRKTKAFNYARTDRYTNYCPVHHELFLVWPYDLVEGTEYTLSFEGGTLPNQDFVHSPSTLRSQALHVSQIGFRPDDPYKLAFLSTWMGDGGRLDYTTGIRFDVLENATGASVFDGTTTLQKAYDSNEFNGKNCNKTNVYQMDFSSFVAPGTYRIMLQGVGCSYPFTIGPNVWGDAFKKSVRLLYHQRSGIELGSPYTSYECPRDHNPADPWITVRLSSASLMDTHQGLNTSGNSNFGMLLAGLLPPGQTLGPEAWGGYHDASDWDRRIQHLDASIFLLDLAELEGDYFNSLDLNIPANGAYPDIIAEALFNIDFYKRLQTPAGGVRGGIEHDAHQRKGETSWQDTNLTIAYAPGPWSSWYYSGAAAMAAYWLEDNGYTSEAQEYKTSAINAMNWAKSEDLGDYIMGSDHNVVSMKNFAAAALFRLTGDTVWHDDFIGTTDCASGTAYPWDQKHGIWLYARTDRPGMNQTIKTNCRNSYTNSAATQRNHCDNTGFRWAMPQGYFLALGTFSVPMDSYLLVRSHALTGDASYLQGLFLECQTGGGANPDNMCYTTGVGSNYPLHPLHWNARFSSSLHVPEGLTVLGPVDNSVPFLGGFPPHKLFTDVYYPSVGEWPVIESYNDVFLDPLATEFTIHQILAPNFYAWGYLASVAR